MFRELLEQRFPNLGSSHTPLTLSHDICPKYTHLIEDTIGDYFDDVANHSADKEVLFARHKNIHMSHKQLQKKPTNWRAVC